MSAPGVAETVVGQFVDQVTAERYHDISAGHRVYGHEGVCAHLHGHNYRVHFTCIGSKLDAVGRVIDFSIIKERLCTWLDDNWDHRFLMSANDPWVISMKAIDPSLVVVPFNPTAELLAAHLVRTVGPFVLQGTGVTLTICRVEETRKCSATYTRSETIFSSL